MMTLDDARAMVQSAVSVLDPIRIARDDAIGAVLAVDIVASEAVPPFANTAMDGYALIAADTRGATEQNPVRLLVIGDLAAGAAPHQMIRRGEAIRIMTGAPMPQGADAVMMVERTERDDANQSVLIQSAAKSGDHVRRAGGDVDAGTVVFAAGTVLRPAHLGVLASLDIAMVEVVRRARVGVLSTGDEIVASGALGPGKIRDSNRPMLLAMVAEAGCEPVDLGIAPDNEATIFAAIRVGVDTCDALLTSGAVSVGDYDFVKVAIERLANERGGEYGWQQVAIKPAKPLAFATVRGASRNVPIFGLPGNPVSSHVSYELFARPVLRMMMGHTDTALRPIVQCVAPRGLLRRLDGKLHLDRVRVASVDGALECERSGEQASNVLSGMAAAQGLAMLSDGEGVQPGDVATVMLLSDL